MGTITVKIKKNPLLCDMITDDGTLYYEYDNADTDSITVYIAAKTAIDIIESGKYYLANFDLLDDSEQKEISVESPENSRFHVCIVDGEKNTVDVLVSKPIFVEYLVFMLKDEKQRNEYRRHKDIFVDFSSVEAQKTALDTPLDEVICKRDINQRLQQALDSLTSLQYKHLIMHFLQSKTVREIGAEENTSHVNIVLSIRGAIKKLKGLIEA